MKTSPCKSLTVVASRTLSETQADLPRSDGSVRARERRWRSRRFGGGHTTVRRLHDEHPAASLRPGAPTTGGYVVRDATGQALAYLYGRETDADARQARLAINVVRLPELLGKANRD